MPSIREKARLILDQLKIEGKSQWVFKTESNFSQQLELLTNTFEKQTIDRFAKIAILDFLKTTVVTNCPDKWQPEKVDLSIEEATNWMNTVPLKEAYLDEAVNEIKRRNSSNDGYLTLVSIANYIYQKDIAHKLYEILKDRN